MDTSVPVFQVAGDPTDQRNFSYEINYFSNEVFHIPGICTTVACYLINDFYFQDTIFLDIYANGKSIEDKGYVSLFIQIKNIAFLSYLPPLFEFSCVMSIVDISGHQRFPQSFIIPQSCLQKGEEVLFGFDKFLARETILREQSDLLPDDSLTIHFYCDILERIHNEFHPFLETESALDTSFEEIRGNPGGRGKFFLDSVLFQKLSQFSEVFQVMSQTQMKEKQQGFIEIGKSEFKHLKTFCLMLMGQCYRSLDMSDVSAMFKLAHEYKMDIFLDMLREFMKRILSPVNVPEIADIAREYDDSNLEDIVDNFLRTEHGGETEADIENFYQSNNEERVWKLFSTRYVLCINETSEGMSYDEHPDFDFYK